MISIIIQYWFVLGSGLFILEGSILRLFRWHTITLSRTDQSFTFIVNNDQQTGLSPGTTTHLSLGTPLYIGGYSLVELEGSVPHPNMGFDRGFTGCIHDVQV